MNIRQFCEKYPYQIKVKDMLSIPLKNKEDVFKYVEIIKILEPEINAEMIKTFKRNLHTFKCGGYPSYYSSLEEFK